MFGIPLHPVVVHFPIVLAIFLPISAVVALWAIRRGTTARRGWTVPLVLAAALAASAFAATQTGDREEDRVERVAARSAIHDHEEAGERFLVLSAVLLLVAAAGLVRGTIGQAARRARTSRTRSGSPRARGRPRRAVRRTTTDRCPRAARRFLSTQNRRPSLGARAAVRCERGARSHSEDIATWGPCGNPCPGR